MLERIRARGVTLTIGQDGQLSVAGTLTALQRKYLTDHAAELLGLLWVEDGKTTCPRCGKVFDCHTEGEYRMNGEGILCGECTNLRLPA